MATRLTIQQLYKALHERLSASSTSLCSGVVIVSVPLPVMTKVELPTRSAVAAMPALLRKRRLTSLVTWA